MKCVGACAQEHGFPNAKNARFSGGEELSATRLTALAKAGPDRYVRQHCVHCIEPACESACPVGALHRTADGPVVYDADKCIGCRYCMLACPFEVPRYEWDRLLPFVQKCDMCFERPEGPACVEACPHDATVFGERQALLDEAHRRIEAAPDKYVQHVWGEHEMGGTAVLFVSDVPLDSFWPSELGQVSVPDLTLPLAAKTPILYGGILATLAGLSWVIHRRQRLADEAAAASAADSAEGEGGDA
jgi:formate dehydrogenase iron-sulfur subunit